MSGPNRVAKCGGGVDGRVAEHGSDLVHEIAGSAVGSVREERRDERAYAFDRALAL
jgi:hypothetical protein